MKGVSYSLESRNKSKSDSFFNILNSYHEKRIAGLYPGLHPPYLGIPCIWTSNITRLNFHALNRIIYAKKETKVSLSVSSPFLALFTMKRKKEPLDTFFVAIQKKKRKRKRNGPRKVCRFWLFQLRRFVYQRATRVERIVCSPPLIWGTP